MVRGSRSVTWTEWEINHCVGRDSWTCRRMETTITILSWWMCTTSTDGKSNWDNDGVGIFITILSLETLSPMARFFRSPSIIRQAIPMPMRLKDCKVSWLTLINKTKSKKPYGFHSSVLAIIDFIFRKFFNWKSTFDVTSIKWNH